MEKHLQQSLDRSINHHYQDICYNPNKKETLRRLSQQPRLYNQAIHDSSYFNQQEALDVTNNESLNMYIQHVYRKYDIQDPINKFYRYGHTEDTRDVTVINTPFKQTQKIQQTTQSQKITSTKKKLLQMRQNYKKDCNDIISSVFYPVQQMHRERQSSGIAQSRIAKQIGYRTRQKIHFKTLTNEDTSILQRTFQSVSSPMHTVRHSNVRVRFNYNPEQPQRTRRGRVVSENKVSFRYCPMCEEVILHDNISFHEANCTKIQQGYNLPLKQLQKVIKQKIRRIKDEIQRQLRSQNDQTILKEYHTLNRSLVQWLNKEDEQSFQKVREGYQEMALKQFDLIAKLRWFKNLHRTIIGEINSTSR